MPLLINETDELFATISNVQQLMHQSGGEAAFIDLLLNLFARQVEVTIGEDERENVVLDQDLVDKLVIYTYVGRVAVMAAEETIAMAAEVKKLDQVEETDGQTGPSTTTKENL